MSHKRRSTLAHAREPGVAEVGEIWVRSGQNMAGYGQRTDETAATLTAEGWLRAPATRPIATSTATTVDFVDALPRNAFETILKKTLRVAYWADSPTRLR
jgi:hypothetical protein